MTLDDCHAAAVLMSLKDQWQNTPPSWGKSDDPCGAPWEGVACNNSRVTALGLSTMGLSGTLSGDIGGLTGLISIAFLKEESTASLSLPWKTRVALTLISTVTDASCRHNGTVNRPPPQHARLQKLADP
ncbi:hypothetical protein RJ639_036138 [Escallonia herrerae]|uniref:Leucine-rich repeat-containing N-terminal plant-type domain-containing protein n=1 Tax=Escallonia herrerae TaxID=1293975 RepID=A0AA88WQT2_9ASTE|nr:hypothetical protein RJ639_036138 [Escallonia herrerae]